MSYGNIIYALAFATLGIVIALAVFSLIKTRKKAKKRETETHRAEGTSHGVDQPGRARR